VGSIFDGVRNHARATTGARGAFAPSRTLSIILFAISTGIVCARERACSRARRVEYEAPADAIFPAWSANAAPER
jgi:hypothetical protein